MAMWAIESEPYDSEYRQAIDAVAVLYGPVVDTEGVLTDLDLRRGAFRALTEDQRNKLRGRIRRCLRDYFKSIGDQQRKASQYEALARRIGRGDVVVTFNYDVSLENALIRAHRFRVRNGYGGFEANWDEPDSDVRVIKVHGSINWIGALFGGGTEGCSVFSNGLGERPFVDNEDSVLPDYPRQVLDKAFPNGGVTSRSTTLVLPTYEKQYSVTTSVGVEWSSFYESLWSQAAESLQQSDRIVIIGYSMPEADHRARALLLWCNNKRTEVLLCCAASNEALKRSFETHGFWRVREIGTFETAFR